MIAEHLPALMAGWSVQLVGAASPGPAVALVVGVAAARGRGAALATTAGVALGSATLAFAVVLGLATLLAATAGALTVLRVLGAAYLAWLAWQALRRAIHPPPLVTLDAPAGASWRLARQGWLLQVTNPKSLLVWIAVAALSDLQSAPLPVILIFLGGAFISLAGHGVWALALSAAPARAAYQRARRRVEAGLGALFASASFALLLERS